MSLNSLTVRRYENISYKIAIVPLGRFKIQKRVLPITLQKLLIRATHEVAYELEEKLRHRYDIQVLWYSMTILR